MKRYTYRGFLIEQSPDRYEGYTLSEPGLDPRDELNRRLAFAIETTSLGGRSHANWLLTHAMSTLRYLHPIDGVPWEIHAIPDPEARRTAALSYLKEAHEDTDDRISPASLGLPRARLSRSGE